MLHTIPSHTRFFHNRENYYNIYTAVLGENKALDFPEDTKETSCFVICITGKTGKGSDANEASIALSRNISNIVKQIPTTTPIIMDLSDYPYRWGNSLQYMLIALNEHQVFFFANEETLYPLRSLSTGLFGSDIPFHYACEWGEMMEMLEKDKETGVPYQVQLLRGDLSGTAA
jgi:hypothetical protein